MLWGTTPETRIIWWVSDFLAALMMFQCAAFWLMLLGSSGFLVWFIPSYLSAFALFVYLNYYTHIMDKDGSPVVLNRNDGLFKLGNQLLFGVFFHKNHHDRASLFNPQTS
jgi:stearoyl-CoA desaturase (delta-9 desaturase)